MKRPDFAVPIGILVGLTTICGGAMIEGLRLGVLFQPNAALIVIGGTVGAIIVRRGISGLVAALRAATSLCFEEDRTEIEVTQARLAWLARLAKREGVQVLEAHASNSRDPLIVQALTLAAQYAEPAVIRERLERILDYEDECGLHEVTLLEGAASYAPTFGILGAVLGLIQVLRALADPATLGVGIATAFVATIYGVGVANLILFPLAARLRERHLGRMRQREAVAEALVALASHETPGVILRKFAAEPGLVSHKGKALTG